MKSYNVFSFKQRIKIFCGLNILITPIVLAFTSILQFHWHWIKAIILIAAGSVIVTIVNYRKYHLVAEQQIVTFQRAVVIDSLCLIIAFVISWVYLFGPYLFSKESFLAETVILPFPIWIICIPLALPFILTNKKILKDLKV